MRQLLNLTILATAFVASFAANITAPATAQSGGSDAVVTINATSTYDNVTGSMYLTTWVNISNYAVPSGANSPYIAIQY